MTAEQSRKAKRITLLTLREVLLICAAITLLFPLAYMLICSGKSSAALSTSPFSLPDSWEQIVANYTSVFTGKVSTGRVEIQLFTPYLTILWNQIVLVAAALVFMLIFATPIGYCLGKRQFKGKKLYMSFVILTQTVPLFGYLLAFYYLMDLMKMTNDLFAIGLIFSATSMPTSIIFMRGFFEGLPKEVEEAAKIDGAGELTRFFRIILPLSKGIIVSIALVQFMGYWNEYAISNLLITEPELRTISISVMMTAGDTGGNYPTYTYALLVMSALPSLIFFTIFNKSITKGGLAMGSIKG
mgnify:CR=1 FL=1